MDKERVVLANEEALRTEARMLDAAGEVLRLHEERAKVEVLHEERGAVVVRKVVTERQETLPVTLISERLEITVREGSGVVTLDGQVLEPGRSYEVLLSEERAVVQKELYHIADVNIRKDRHQEVRREEITLRREELDVQGDRELIREI